MRFTKLNLFALAMFLTFGTLPMVNGQTSPPAGAADRLKGADRGKPSGAKIPTAANVPSHLGPKVQPIGASPAGSTRVDANFEFEKADCTTGARKEIYGGGGKTYRGSDGQNYICEIKFHCTAKSGEVGQGDKSRSSGALTANLTATCWPKPKDAPSGGRNRFSCEMTWAECTGKYDYQETDDKKGEGQPSGSIPKDSTPAAGAP